jgi:hypothetical protein
MEETAEELAKPTELYSTGIYGGICKSAVPKWN